MQIFNKLSSLIALLIPILLTSCGGGSGICGLSALSFGLVAGSACSSGGGSSGGSAGAETIFAGPANSQDATTGVRTGIQSPRIAVDSSGNVYATSQGNTIQKITAAGVITTFAGTTAGSSGSADGIGAAAEFNRPTGAAVDSSGNVYVADTGNHTIRKITAAGAVTTLAGTAGSSGSADGTGAAARFNVPSAVAVDSSGNVYVADSGNHTIRKITAAGAVTTLAGTAGSSGSADGTGAAARFNVPIDVAVDSSGNLYVAERRNHTIRKITAAGAVTTLAGTAGSPGSADGTGAGARFFEPIGVAVDSVGNVYVADTENNTIRKITSTGVVSTFAGTAGTSGLADGTGAAARFNLPMSIAVDSGGNVYVATARRSHTIRKINAAGVVTTIDWTAGLWGSTDGTGAAARFFVPAGAAADASGNLFVADLFNHTIRKITSAGVVSTFAGTAGSSGSADGTGAAARFFQPNGVAVDSVGNVYVADMENNTIRKITVAGVVTTFATSSWPTGIAVDSGGNVYVADGSPNTIRKITAAGVVTLVAGSAGGGGSTDGTGADARFATPRGMAVDSSGNLYVADSRNHTIRKITSAGVVSTFAGTAGSSGSADGTGAAARFWEPSAVAFDPSGNVYVADTYNDTIRKITAAGVVTTLAKSSRPYGVAVDPSGKFLFVTDPFNATVQKIILIP